ncbi:MAG: DUF4914 family protein [Chitinivibrionales bacterium]|nr:DUF4914 family protein [Chitinivibrionales bacterium]
MDNEKLEKITMPDHVRDIVFNAGSCRVIDKRSALLRMATGGDQEKSYAVSYNVGDKQICEATVVACNNGFAVNYMEPYMRRRDPECMLIGDDKPTDKALFKDRVGRRFDSLREETFLWLKEQDLVVTAFTLGALESDKGYGGLLIAPSNAGFFIAGLADLQGIVDIGELREPFTVHTVVFLAPPFRHTHFGGKQTVVHNRLSNVYEIFSYNLYPGPSAKKGIYGSLLSIGEKEHWTTLHASTVQVQTPYDNITTIMHEGASGGGKSEMLEYAHREEDGRLFLGENAESGEKKYLSLPRGCVLKPVTDDMAMCRDTVQNEDGYIIACDAEQAWFLRLNHIKHYGTDPHLERLTVHPDESLIFLNLKGAPDSTCLIWEHMEDKPGVRCPNPRVIMPRRLIPDVIEGNVEVHIRNFGIRTPPCTSQNPSYGIIGFLHLLPPALAWLWRLVAPRGYDNPSITEAEMLQSEGVGSFWPFASGKMVVHANLLLKQMQNAPKTKYTLTPNQNVGAWRVSFMPQWIAREYLGRRGVAPFRAEQLVKSKCPLLGYTLRSMQVEGYTIPHELLRVNEQPEVGTDGFEKGAKMLHDFFKKELTQYLNDDIDPSGRRIIECCIDNGTLEDYESCLVV